MRLPKFIITTFISIIALAGLLVGGGVAYTWYMGQNEVAITAATAEPADTQPIIREIKPSKPSPDARVGASVHMLTSPVAPGDNASITIKTIPTAQCKISVVYGTVTSKDSGLLPKVADDFGLTTWTWTVEESVPHGKWPVNVSCEYNKRSAVVVGDLVVAAATQ